MPTVESLTEALNELKGFSERNLERAKAATKDAALSANTHDLISAKAREHEAERVKLVITERVKEALR